MEKWKNKAKTKKSKFKFKFKFGNKLNEQLNLFES